ncbi:MAG: HAMP domain-containing histidine kinase [Bacteroidales bacterium]|nr:HAMP domain-containing histidine kinase [Bacteroidales bacterium]
MVYKNFRIKIIIRVILIGFSIFLLVFALYQDKWYFTSASLFLIVLTLLLELIFFVEKYNRDFNSLLFSIKHHDFTKSFITSSKKKITDEQKNAFNIIINEFQNIRIEKESHYEYLKTLVEHIKTGIICFDENGDVNLVNTAAKNILNLNLLKNMESVKQADVELFNVLNEIKSGEKKVVKIKAGQEIIQLIILCTEFKLKNKLFKLASFQNIKNELDEQELEAWQKLIRILNHEIMNTVTPISSLSSEINEMLDGYDEGKRNLSEIDEDDMDDIYQSLKTIERRSKGLLKFVKTYKNISRLPKPDFADLKVEDIFRNIKILMEPELKKNKIQIIAYIDKKDMFIRADREMIEQVLINLILNAKDAMKDQDKPLIELKAIKTKENKVYIQVTDNGTGIETGNIDNIFVPFFTTKKNGSGIGLSLSKQIIRLCNGSISVQSEPGKGSVFSLSFQKIY